MESRLEVVADTDYDEVPYMGFGGVNTNSIKYKTTTLCHDKRIQLAMVAIAVVFIFLIGMLCGHLINGSPLSTCDSSSILVRSPLTKYDAAVGQKFQSFVSPDRLRGHLEQLTSRVHIAGTPANNATMQYIRDHLTKLDVSYRLHSYKVLLNTADLTRSEPNRVRIIKANGSVVWHSQDYPLHMWPFLAYSANGTITGDPVYMNYGATSDFESGANCSGNIAIIRYGNGGRGSVVQRATDFNCSGVVLYMDPADFGSSNISEVWPNGMFIDGNATLRGTLLVRKARLFGGDEFYPNLLETIPRPLTTEQKDKWPKIPAIPVSFNDAKQILDGMSGEEVSSPWKGAIPDLVYKKGPGYTTAGRQLQVETHSVTTSSVVTNIVATFRGRIEPDRYILLGSHYDAWTFGASDPHSGTIGMLELINVLKELQNTGWQPRRSIVLIFHDAEEFGLLGSAELTKQFYREFSAKAVSYLNFDSMVKGNFIPYIRSSPMLDDVIYAASKVVKAPNSDETIYDRWYRLSDHTDHSDTRPNIDLLGRSSDYVNYVNFIGCSGTDMQYWFDFNLHSKTSLPAYHTQMDNFTYFENFVDPGFTATSAMTKWIGDIVLRLADSANLPLNCSALVEYIEVAHTELSDDDIVQTLNKEIPDGLNVLQRLIFTRLRPACNSLEDSLTSADPTAFVVMSDLNDRLMEFPRQFIYPSAEAEPYIRDILLSTTTAGPKKLYQFAALRGALLQKDSVLIQQEFNRLYSALTSSVELLQGGLIQETS